MHHEKLMLRLYIINFYLSQKRKIPKHLLANRRSVKFIKTYRIRQQVSRNLYRASGAESHHDLSAPDCGYIAFRAIQHMNAANASQPRKE